MISYTCELHIISYISFYPTGADGIFKIVLWSWKKMYTYTCAFELLIGIVFVVLHLMGFLIIEFWKWPIVYTCRSLLGISIERIL